ncbi:MAG: class I SAM-dependent methyltransferase [Gammaproteobacteria bacterium]|nr:class I SAM-dependent methyltransferase [Gammaproteobacteria bacterium]MCP5140090.1 class I SAM-dependent methyltransferase [Chromatiales bacterium]
MTDKHVHANPVRGRFNSWLLAKYEDDFHEEMGERKQQHIGALNGTVVEIGAGNGVNFRYYPPGVRLIVYEPNPWMHERLRQAAGKYGLDCELRPVSAEQLDLPAQSVDAVVCTLVLCTVDDPGQILREVRRVLKPGGKFFFLEHVAAPRGSGLRRVQDLLMRPWRWLFEGCHTNRETAALLEAAGFSSVEIERFRSRKMPPVIVPVISGVATR